MALEPEYLEFIDRCLRSTFGEVRGRRMLELGDQLLVSPDGRVEGGTGKDYYTGSGVEHLSIDLNGRNGALPLDLAVRHDRPDWRGRFDVITNAGTTEHVEPLEAQYTCFESLHDWLKVGGVAVHLVPCIEELEANGSWKGHCNNYYSVPFFETLAALNGYRTIASTRIKHLLAVGVVKEMDRPFTTDRGALLRHIARREGGVVYDGINDGRSAAPAVAGGWWALRASPAAARLTPAFAAAAVAAAFLSLVAGGSAPVLLATFLLACHLGGIPLPSPILALHPRRSVRRLSLATFLFALVRGAVGGVTAPLLCALVVALAVAVMPAWKRRPGAAGA